MELLSSLNEINIANNIKGVIEKYNITSKKNSNLSQVKTELKRDCGLVFFNIISSSNESLKVMAKTLKHSYFYDYNYGSKEISLVGGVRKNVVTS